MYRTLSISMHMYILFFCRVLMVIVCLPHWRWISFKALNAYIFIYCFVFMQVAGDYSLLTTQEVDKAPAYIIFFIYCFVFLHACRLLMVTVCLGGILSKHLHAYFFVLLQGADGYSTLTTECTYIHQLQYSSQDLIMCQTTQ